MTGIILIPAVARNELRALARLPRMQQSWRLSYSRASCIWAHANVSRGPRGQVFAKKCWEVKLGKGGALSTSAVWRSQPGVDNETAKIGTAAKNPKAQSPNPKQKLPALAHENIYTLPNILTFSRLLSTPLLGYLIIHNQHLYAFTLFLYAGISDVLDGWIARKYNLQTVVGSVVDPMADKALMTTLVCCLAVNGTLPPPLAVLILGRDLSLAVAAIYYRYASLPAPKTLRRYWDFSLPSAEVHPTTISKLNTFLQLGLIGTTLCVSLLHDPSAINSAAGDLLMTVQGSLGGPEGVEKMVRSMQGLVMATTVYSGFSYVWTKDAVKMLGDDEKLKRKQGARGRMIVGGSFGIVVAVAGWLAWREWTKSEEADVEVEV